MQETYEFRVVEDFAERLFTADEGKKLASGMVRLVKVAANDRRLPRIGELQRDIDRECGRSFFHGWEIQRRYTKDELETAALLRVKVSSAFEPAGEECGTKYNESEGCLRCKAGAKQISHLFLNWKRIPRNRDISRTIAGEIVVSRRAAEIFRIHQIAGVEFRPIRGNPSSSAESKDWFQLVVKCTQIEIVPPTRAGIDPFDDDRAGEFRCPFGDLIGLNLLSELSIRSATRSDDDLACTRQFIGTRRGLLRPERILLISPRMWRIIELEKLKGFEVEVAHVV